MSDPTGYGQGTANEIKYVQAKLQSKGWTIVGFIIPEPAWGTPTQPQPEWYEDEDDE